jgi:hypothetical protein
MTASIEAMARDAGFTPCFGGGGQHVQPAEAATLARFAALVRAQALEDAARAVGAFSARTDDETGATLALKWAVEEILTLPPSAG